jgi:hypothetical protein
MAIFRAYAKVLEPGDPSTRSYATPLLPRFRADISEVAELTSDAELLAIAELTEVPVSLEHLRGLDPQTRIVIRTELRYEAAEGAGVSSATERRPARATVMPDGTVIAGDAFPGPSAPTSLRAGTHTSEPGGTAAGRRTSRQ